LADDEEVAAALRPKYGGRWILDRHRLTQPGLERLARGAAGGLSASGVAHTGGQAASGTEFFLQYALEEMVLAEIRRGVAFEDDLRARCQPARAGQRLHAVEVIFLALVREPDDLEEVVAFLEAVGVVVNRFAGPG